MNLELHSLHLPKFISDRKSYDSYEFIIQSLSLRKRLHTYIVLPKGHSSFLSNIIVRIIKKTSQMLNGK